jgi:hypothetical protein
MLQTFPGLIGFATSPFAVCWPIECLASKVMSGIVNWSPVTRDIQ